MIITKVELNNITTHENSVIELKPGINVFYGKNGSGKTTILKMIGYVLFDKDLSPIASYIRNMDKNKKAYVQVHFKNENNENWIIERSINPNQIKIMDSNGRIISTIRTKSDYLNWLKNQFNLDKNYELNEIFDNCIGVDQGTFTAPFLSPEKTRKKIFEPILKVDIYEKIWEKFLNLINPLKDKILNLEKEICELEGILRDKQKVIDQLNEKEKEIKNLQNKKNEYESKLSENKDLFKSLEKIKNEIDKQKQEIEIINRNIENINESIKEKGEKIKVAQNARKICENTKEDYKKYEELENQQKGLLDKIKSMEEIEKKKNDKEIEKTKLESELNQLKNQIDEINKQSTEKDKLEKSYNDKINLDKERQNLEKELSIISSKEEELKTFINTNKTLEKEINELQIQVKNIKEPKELETQLEQLRNDLEKSNQELNELKSKQKEYQKFKSQSKGGLCPFLGTQCQNIGFKSLEDYFNGLLNELKPKTEFLENEVKNLQLKITQKEKEIKENNELKIKEGLYQEKKNNFDKNQIKIKELENICKSKDEKEKKIKDIVSKIKILQPDYEKYIKIQGMIENKNDLENKLQLIEPQLKKLIKEIEEMNNKIKDLPSLKINLENLQNQLNQLSKNRDDYLKNVNESEKLEIYIDERNKLEEKHKQNEIKFKDLEKCLNELSSKFNETEYKNLKLEIDNLNHELGNITGKISEIQKLIEDYQKKIEEYKEKEKEIKVKKDEHKKLNNIENFLERLRNWFRELGPEIAKILLNKISLNATRIVQEIMDDTNISLEWEQNYNVKLKKLNQDKDFKQLSGGEQMAVALSIRIAILRLLSSIKFAFFDEPTINLDIEKRQNLANFISKISELSQIIVISHDETFEGLEGNVISFTKNDQEVTTVQVLK